MVDSRNEDHRTISASQTRSVTHQKDAGNRPGIAVAIQQAKRETKATKGIKSNKSNKRGILNEVSSLLGDNRNDEAWLRGRVHHDAAQTERAQEKPLVDTRLMFQSKLMQNMKS
jgi:hypothetical protein